MNIPQEMTTKVQGLSESPTKISLRSGKFKMTIDEPEQMGGTNEGPTPMQVMLFALAGCLNMTSHVVAREKGINIKSLKIEINGGMNPMKFMGINDDKRAGFESVKIILTPEFEENYDELLIAQWVKETEERCPVTDNIKDKTQIEIKVLESVE